MTYVDGFVLAVPTSGRDAYRVFAAAAVPVFKEHGALQVVERTLAWPDRNRRLAKDVEALMNNVGARCGDAGLFERYVEISTKITRISNALKTLSGPGYRPPFQQVAETVLWLRKHHLPWRGRRQRSVVSHPS